jgi:hypothetical protein
VGPDSGHEAHTHAALVNGTPNPLSSQAYITLLADKVSLPALYPTAVLAALVNPLLKAVNSRYLLGNLLGGEVEFRHECSSWASRLRRASPTSALRGGRIGASGGGVAQSLRRRTRSTGYIPEIRAACPECWEIDADRYAVLQVVVPVSPVETGVAASMGPLNVWEATQAVAEERLALILQALRAENISVEGTLGDQRPLQALAEAASSFRPDQIVIATPPPQDSVWHTYDVVDRARTDYDVPVTHVIGDPVRLTMGNIDGRL